VPAGHGDLIGGHLAQAAHAAGLVEDDVTDPAAVDALRVAMAGGARWLLILDDLPPGAGTPGLPAGARIIVTGPGPGDIEVRPFRPEETAALLRQRLPGPAEEMPGLGGLPFAVAQAAALIGQAGVPATAFGSPSAGTALAIDRLDRNHPAAAQLLCLCAVLAATPAPVDLFTRSLDRLPGPLGAVSAHDFYGLVDALTSHGLVSTGVDGLRTHPLVRDAVRDQLGPAEAVCRRYAGMLVAAALPDDVQDPATWPRWVALAPHLLAAGPGHSTDTAVRAGAYRLVASLLRRAAPAAALSLVADLHGCWRELLGPEHPDTLRAAVTHAATLLALGRLRAAREITGGVLPVCLEVLGDHHPDTLRGLAVAASVTAGLGDPARGRDLHRTVLAGRLAAFGPDHPDTLGSGRDLARCLYQLGRHEETRELAADVLDRARRVLGPDHPDTLASASDLAVTLTALRAHGDAVALAEDTLRRRRRVLGDHHPQTLASRHCLATVRYDTGARAEGRRIYQEVLAQRTAALGPEHPDTLRSAHSVAVALLAAGAVLPARALLDATLDRLARTLGTGHPLTRDVRDTRQRALVRMGGMPRRPRKPVPRKGRR
jgi:hypothetical protein